MSDGNPVTGQPYGGRDERPEGAGLPGERPEKDSQDAPDDGREVETSSRAAQEGAMPSDAGGETEPTEGIPEQVDAPSPADATEGDPPGGSAANQRGRAPNQ